MKHKAILVRNLMYKGCEPHLKCKICGECVPLHCYTKTDFENRCCGCHKVKCDDCELKKKYIGEDTNVLTNTEGEGMMGCMCGDCKHPENINSVLTICRNKNSLNYGKIISLAWDSCDDGEVDDGESEDTE